MSMKTVVEIDALALETLAKRIRIGSLAAIYHAGSGHPGGSLSAADLLAVLWGQELQSPCQGGSHRFVLSKGHACPALYAAAAEVGILARSALLTFRKLGSMLQGHPHVLCTPWVEASTGSLGQGFSSAIGMAMGLRYRNRPERVYVLLGDGELQEGEVWEGAMCAAHYRLDNLCAIVDYNKMQSDDFNDRIMNLEPLGPKWEAFNWHVLQINGHDYGQILKAFEVVRQVQGKPALIIAHTVKGKGVSFMEGVPAWHGSVKLREKEFQTALQDLDVPEHEIGSYLNGTIWSE